MNRLISENNRATTSRVSTQQIPLPSNSIFQANEFCSKGVATNFSYPSQPAIFQPARVSTLPFVMPGIYQPFQGVQMVQRVPALTWDECRMMPFQPVVLSPSPYVQNWSPFGCNLTTTTHSHGYQR